MRDPIPLSRHPELYRPLLLERLLHLPPPSVPLTVTLYLVIMVSAVVAAANRLPRIAGWVVAAAFTWWTAIGMSYGKVDHDHLALVVALWVLPTVGVVAGRWRSTDRSAQAGWALKCIQIAVVFTYFLSALTKIRSGGWSLTSWPESSILLWAIIRRPNGLGQFLIPYPRAAALDAVGGVSRRAQFIGGALAPRPGAAAGRPVLDQLPHLHRDDPLHPLRTDADLLARLRSARAPRPVAPASRTRVAGPHARAVRLGVHRALTAVGSDSYTHPVAGRINEEDIATVRDRARIEEVVGSYVDAAHAPAAP